MCGVCRWSLKMKKNHRVFYCFFVLCLSFILVMAGFCVSASAPPVIILDPGHGGEDGGAVGISGSVEKDLNLDLAKKMAELFSGAGYEVILSRSGDEDTDGRDGFYKRKDILARLALAEQYPNSVFISIHMNSSTSEKDKGFQVFYGLKNGRSSELAEAIYASVFKNMEVTRLREVKKAPETVYLMKNLTIPAVLIECGFISNRSDATLLNDPAYRENLAFVLYNGIVDFIEKRTDLSSEGEEEDILTGDQNILATSRSQASQDFVH